MKHETYMDTAWSIANKESKCISMKVGALIVKNDHILSHGYNGSPMKHPNCCDVAVEKGFGELLNGKVVLNKEKRHLHSQWSEKNEIHAEQNAIIFAAREGLSIKGATLYTTHSPCPMCCKLLSQSGITHIFYDILYDRSPSDWKDILVRSGIKVEKL